MLQKERAEAAEARVATLETEFTALQTEHSLRAKDIADHHAEEIVVLERRLIEAGEEAQRLEVKVEDTVLQNGPLCATVKATLPVVPAFHPAWYGWLVI